MAADEGANNQPETAASTPNSGSGPQSATKAAKDRACPFCGQSFTSSSLGRHLDLYIKPRNPKPADGVHDVDEIRKIRGNITRRQPRTSARLSSADPAREESIGAPPVKSASTQSHVADDSPIVSPVNAKDIQEGQTLLNHANWQATGVINNIPSRAPSRSNDSNDRQASGQTRRIDDMRRDTGGNRIQRPEYESEGMWRLQQDAELGRAAEMALREVLGSLEAASKRIEPKTLFDDFDFYSLSFPGLCLAILPPPGTLFAPSPFPSAESWTIGPPVLRQYEAMVRYVREKTAAKRKSEHIPDSVAFKHHSHLSGAWEHWQTMSEADRSSAWTLEILRSFTRSQQQKHHLRTELEHSQQRVRHLEAEYDRLSRCQLPREYLMHPPNTIPITPESMREVKPANFSSGIKEVNYDADALISKWRSTIRATTRPPRSSHQSTGSSSALPNNMRDDMVMSGAVWTVGGPVPRARQAHTEQPTGLTPVAYETPPNPGAVVDAEDEEGDAEGEAEDEIPSGGYGNYGQFAVVKRINGGGGALNVNGKRPFATTTTTTTMESGRGAPKLYKAHD